MTASRQRTVLGVLSVALGVLAVGFSLFGLLFTQLIAGLGKRLPPDAAPMVEAQQAMREVWQVHLPIWALLGALALVAGIGILRGRRYAPPMLLGVSVLGLALLPLYLAHLHHTAMPAFRVLFSRHPLMGGAEGVDRYLLLSVVMGGVPALLVQLAFTGWVARFAWRERHPPDAA